MIPPVVNQKQCHRVAENKLFSFNVNSNLTFLTLHWWENRMNVRLGPGSITNLTIHVSFLFQDTAYFLSYTLIVRFITFRSFSGRYLHCLAISIHLSISAILETSYNRYAAPLYNNFFLFRDQTLNLLSTSNSKLLVEIAEFFMERRF